MRKSWVRCPGCKKKLHAKKHSSGTVCFQCKKAGKGIEVGRFR